MDTERNIESKEQHRTSKTLWYLYCLFLAMSLVLMGSMTTHSQCAPCSGYAP